MLKHARKNLQELEHLGITFVHQAEGTTIPDTVGHEKFDIVYSFDVFVHVDIHTLFRTLSEVRSLLKEGGVFMLSVANLCSEEGFARFRA